MGMYEYLLRTDSFLGLAAIIRGHLGSSRQAEWHLAGRETPNQILAGRQDFSVQGRRGRFQARFRQFVFIANGKRTVSQAYQVQVEIVPEQNNVSSSELSAARSR